MAVTSATRADEQPQPMDQARKEPKIRKRTALTNTRTTAFCRQKTGSATG